jgi:hypothetical protein
MAPLPVAKLSRIDRGISTVNATRTSMFRMERRRSSHMLAPSYTVQIVVSPLPSRTSKVTSRSDPRRFPNVLTARTSTRSFGDSRTSMPPFAFLIETVDPAGRTLDQRKFASSCACA